MQEATVVVSNAVRQQAEHMVATVVTSPPFQGDGDRAFSHIKIFARLSQDLQTLEEKLQDVYATASELTDLEIDNVVTSIGLEDDLFNKEVIIVEDIVDTGKTLHNFLPKLMHQQPKSLKIATLLHKADATEYPLQLDYVGFSIPNKFVVGYGLDYDGLGRNLKEIYQLV